MGMLRFVLPGRQMDLDVGHLTQGGGGIKSFSMFVPKFVDAPYVMAVEAHDISSNTTSSCTGVAVFTNYVLVVSFCVADLSDPTSITPNPNLKICWQRKDNKTCSRSSKIIMHPNFNPIHNVDDLTIIQLEKNTSYYVDKLGGDLEVQDNCTLFGYGETQKTRLSAQVSYINLAYKPCSSFKRDRTYCVTLREKDQPCQGDFGAPMICDGYLKGIVVDIFSAGGGIKCGDRVPPVGVMIRKLSFYKEWIEEITGLSVQSCAIHISSKFLLPFLIQIKLF